MSPWLFLTAIVVGVGAIGPYSNSSRTQTFSPATSNACSGCSASVGLLDVKWEPQIVYHTAATLVITPNNATNATQTRTITAPSFVLPPSIQNIALTVHGSVLSTEFAGTAYSLTYPTPFSGLADVQVTEQYRAIDSAGRTTCTSSATTLSYLYLSSPQASGIAGVPQGCSLSLNKPPIVLVQVSYVTATVTRPAIGAVQFATGQAFAAPQPNPAVPIVKATTTPTPEALGYSTAAVLTPTAIPTPYSNDASGSSSSSSPAPPDSATTIDGILVAGGAPPASIKQPLPSNALPSLPVVTENGILLAASFPVGPLPTPPQPPLQPSPHTTPTPALAQATNTASISTLPLLPGAPAITLSGTTYSLSPSSSCLLINSQTISPGAPAVTIAGTPYSLASPPTALIIGTPPPSANNANNNGGSGATTLALPPSNAAPAGQSPIAYQTAGVILVPIPSSSSPPSSPSNPYSPNSSSGSSSSGSNAAYLINWQPLLPGAPPVTVNGQTISLQPHGTGVVVGSKTAAVTASGVQALGSALGSAGLVAPKGGSGGKGEGGDGGGSGGEGSGDAFTGGAGKRGLSFGSVAVAVGVVVLMGEGW